jgi:hypothetical protein
MSWLGMLRRPSNAHWSSDMTPTPEQIAAVRKHWPAWDDMTIIRHLQQAQALRAQAQQQRRPLFTVRQVQS